MGDLADRLDRSSTVEVGELGTGVRQAVDAVRTRDQAVIMLEDGAPVAVMISPDRLRRLLDERELLRRLAVGELECLGGDGVPLEEVLGECDRLLEEHG